MTNKPKAIGTAAETAVARYLQAHGWPHAERRALRGNLDCGDITGTPGVCWEVKGGHAAEQASDGQVALWLAETETERINSGADVGVLVLKRKGISGARAGEWWAVLPTWVWVRLLGLDPWEPAWPWPVRITLADCALLLRRYGFGTPEQEVA